LHQPFRQVVVAVCGLLLAVAVRAAAPRGQVAARPTEKPGAAPTEPAVWIKRLAGRFSFDGAIRHEEMTDFERFHDYPDGEVTGALMRLNEWSEPVQGKADCTDLRGGPGLQCVISMVWPEKWRATGKAQLGGVPNLAPAMILAGLAPSITPDGISFLLVDDKGLAHPGSLVLSGDSASARPPCVNLPGVLRCSQKFTITARTDADRLFMQLSIGVRFNRQKTDRKQFLDDVDPDPVVVRYERPTEWVDELLDVSFALKRLPREDARPASGHASRP
jgi:hypothetical protein